MNDPEDDANPEPSQKASTDYQALFDDAKKGEIMTTNPESPLGNLTMLESRRYGAGEEFRFLIHTTLRDPEQTLDYLATTYSGADRKPLNTSLIDQAHTATFEGASGFVLKAPEKADDIIGAWSADVGIDLESTSATAMSGDELLSNTQPGEYNQIHLVRGKVAGMFIRVAADTGKDLGVPDANRALRQLAGERGLPIAEIAVQPREIVEAAPSFTEDGGERSGELYHIVLPHNGYEYRIDIVRGGPDSDISFLDSEGFAMRVAKVDGYDVWDRDLSPADLSSINAGLAALPDGESGIMSYVKTHLQSS